MIQKLEKSSGGRDEKEMPLHINRGKVEGMSSEDEEEDGDKEEEVAEVKGKEIVAIEL